MIDYIVLCVRCKVQKHEWVGNYLHSTIASQFIDKHLKNGCKPQDLHIATKFFENLDTENYIEDTEDYKKDKFIDL